MKSRQRAPREAHPNIGEHDFKTVMRTIAGSVFVITSRHMDDLAGMTATAVCSVTSDPPSVLAVINRSNRSHAIINGSGAFAVHVLPAAQEHLATHFASRPPQPFADIPFGIGVLGSPIILACRTVMECEVASAYEVCTHSIFVGRVVAARASPTQQPLLYHQARFACLR